MYFCKIADSDSTLGCSLSFVQGNSLHPYGYSIYIYVYMTYRKMEKRKESLLGCRQAASLMYNTRHISP